MQVTGLHRIGAYMVAVWVGLLLLMTGPAHAALVITVSASGTVTAGADDGTLTGSADPDLAGLTLTVTQTLEFSGSTFVDESSDPANPYAFFVELVKIEVSVGGSAPVVFDGNSAGFGSAFGLYMIGAGGLNSQSGVVLASGMASALISSLAPFSNDLYQSLNLTLTGSESFGASFNDGSNDAWFVEAFGADVASISVLVTGGETVPEPGTLAVASLSMLCLVIVRRRRLPRTGRPLA